MKARFRSRWSALLLFVLGAAIATAATATAASLVTSKQIKNGTITKKDLSPALRARLKAAGAVGPQGPAGAPGAEGSRGPVGEAGKDGLDGANGSPDTAAQVRDKLLTVDGADSGIDADKIDGKSSADLASVGSEPFHEIGAAGEPGFGYGGGQFAMCVWSNYGFGYETAGFYRDPGGIVHLKGVVRATENNVAGETTCATAISTSNSNAANALGSAIMRLPAGYRPAQRALFASMSGNQLARIEVLTDGAVIPGPPNTFANATQWLPMSGMTFRCGPSGAAGCP